MEFGHFFPSLSLRLIAAIYYHWKDLIVCHSQCHPMLICYAFLSAETLSFLGTHSLFIFSLFHGMRVLITISAAVAVRWQVHDKFRFLCVWCFFSCFEETHEWNNETKIMSVTSLMDHCHRLRKICLVVFNFNLSRV